jgi:dolichyl-diphosphooligosaccharide--protein glycosyltransferase
MAGIFNEQFKDVSDSYNSSSGKLGRFAVAIISIFIYISSGTSFHSYSRMMAQHMSGPSIMFKTRDNAGNTIIIDDYREAYYWLRNNTPADARVMAWWDYGYQITGIANRTSIADGNTWNHEHIATLGRCLTSEESKAHKLIRHIADYVLVWAGGGGDDLAKSPHMARIGNSVYNDICPNDPTCSKYGFTDQRYTPTPMMAKSLLYKLHEHEVRPGVSANPKLFKKVFDSKYGKVRIFKVMDVSKSSKKEVLATRFDNCDAPGSWYCPGSYPKAFQNQITLAGRKAFRQLEDFNAERTKEDDEYQKQYFQRMQGGGK